MKYRLVNEFGNRIVNTDNEIKKNHLLEKGFKIDTKKSRKIAFWRKALR